MKILIYSLNHKPEKTGIGKYNGELAENLVKKGIETEVLCAPPYYPEWTVSSPYSTKRYTTELLDGAKVYRCPVYVPKQPSTIKRLLHLGSFAFCSALKLLTLFKKKYDFIFLVQPTFFCAPFALLFCKLTGTKLVMHIQDYELDAMLGLGMAGDGTLAKLLRKVESWFLKRMDVVSSISFSMLERAKQKGVPEDRLVFFPNWSDINFVSPQTPSQEFRERIGIEPSEKIVLYAGNMGKKQGLEIILDAAKEFSDDEKVRFLLVGAGAQAQELKETTKQLGLTNVSYLPLQAWEDVPAMLAMADVHLVIQKKGAADAVLPSKLTNILAAGGNSIVTAEAGTELGIIHEKNPGIYTLVEPENPEAFILALRENLELVSNAHNEVARTYAENNLDKHAIIESFIFDVKYKLDLLDDDESGLNTRKLESLI
ncbi:colanic acid biosynthesis glycosyltransferase WcaI [Alteromonas aestuariivivens]|uniref:Colanic acid biosynthesis glycosyltransferase WcaI n=2 Tax=Alteromonas aestuariivivens TaxID=1938339 RepID=A0A3D8MC73_9ALTE|nr:colanic acid biosynthesis glycosyltransferase WcaI [Alteromonas aestuariivivens]